MSYHPELLPLLESVSLWADLRHEQGVDTAAIIKRLRKELKEARKALVKTEPGKKALAREPNALGKIRALRPVGPRRYWDSLQIEGLENRLLGAWLGRAAGCTLGVPVENWSIEAMESLAQKGGMDFPPTDYWRTHPQPDEIRYGKDPMGHYLRGQIEAVPVDDDLTYTLLGLLILETYGPAFTTEQVGEAWLKYLPMACTAEEVALENLRNGCPAKKSGVKNNPFQEWIGADIRSDPWGYTAPGWPEKAAELAYRDAHLSHRQNGIYGAMYFSAAIAAAFALDSPVAALEAGLSEIPADCRLARDLRWALETGGQLKGWREGREAVDARFSRMHSVHTNNNACLTVFGLMLGGDDFTKTVGTTVALGLDNDCTAATAGSIFGAVYGIGAIPEHWWRPFDGRTRTYMNGQEWFENAEVVARFLGMAKRVWEGRQDACVTG